MEPTIYKPGSYNTPGIYKGAGGIYKGRGVYNDGSGYNGPFIVLNNCDNIEDKKVLSLIGDDFYLSNLDAFCTLVNSDIFSGTKSIKRTNSSYSSIRNVDFSIYNKLTLEIYIDHMPGGTTDFYFSGVFAMKNNNSDGLYIGGYQCDNFNTSYPIVNWTSTYKAMKLPKILRGHFAAILDNDNKLITVFLNGVKIGSYNFVSLGQNEISQNGSGASSVIEFIAVRKGDFSNNLESFTVPTQKYSLKTRTAPQLVRGGPTICAAG